MIPKIYSESASGKAAANLRLLVPWLDSFMSNITHFLHTAKQTQQEGKSKGIVGSHPKSPARS